MNPNDIIVLALTPGTPLNAKNRIWRSVKHLASFTGLNVNDVVGKLVNDLSNLVVMRASAKKGVLVALKANVPAEAPVVKAQAGNAHVGPIKAVKPIVPQDGPIPMAKDVLAQEGLGGLGGPKKGNSAQAIQEILDNLKAEKKVAFDVEAGPQVAIAGAGVVGIVGDAHVAQAAPQAPAQFDAVDEEDEEDYDEDEDFDDEDLDD